MFVVFVASQPKVMQGIESTLSRIANDWEVECVPDGNTAISIAESRPVDVLISDIGMSTSLLQQVHAKRPETVRIVLSDADNEDAAMRALNFAHRVLPKPVSAEDLVDAVDRVITMQQLLKSEQVRELVGRVDRLPPAPKLYLRLTQEMEDPDSSTSSLAALVSQDPALAAKVLQLCNSAMFAGGRQITDIKSAVTRLGLRALRSIALATEIFTRPGQGAGDAAAIQRCALLASQIAARVASEPDADFASTAALLADLGLLLPGLGAEHGRIGSSSTEPLMHAAAGAYLLGLWGLPMAMVEAVAFHHDPAGAEDEFGIVGAVHVALALACGYEPDLAYLESVGVLGKLERWRELAAKLAAAGD
jgi:HD-like signal output (HDOD) protein/CheY-like chemotaxis protein